MKVNGSVLLFLGCQILALLDQCIHFIVPSKCT
jgi:hypothetical protein